MENENKNGLMWTSIIAGLFALCIGIPGVSRAFKNDTSAWEEMGKIIQTGLMWIGGAIALYVICWIVAFLLRALWDKTDALWVSLDYSKRWCEGVYPKFDEMEKIRDYILRRCKQVEERIEEVCSVVDDHSEELNKLKATPTLQAEVKQQSVEDEFTGSSN